MNFKPRLLLVLTACFIGFGGSSGAEEKPLKIFILVGQSNMQGHAQVRTLAHLGMDDETKPILDEILDAGTGGPKVLDNVWISYLSSTGVRTGPLTTGFGADENKIGPELTFGIYMQKRLGEPILIIKTAWGGKSIHTDFRPPSASAFEFEQATLQRFAEQGKDIDAIKLEKVKATGVNYRQTVEHVNQVLTDLKTVYPNYDAGQGYELAGMVWFQGWNDMVDPSVYPNRSEAGGYDQYSEVLGKMIRDFRKDLSAPNLPVVIGVIGVGGPTDQYAADQERHVKVHQNFRDAMAAPASEKEFAGNVVAVLTEKCWDMELDTLAAKEDQIKRELKQLKEAGDLEQKDWEAELKKRLVEEFTDQERVVLDTGKSNAAYHYLGSGKIIAKIGKAFAEAMPLESKSTKTEAPSKDIKAANDQAATSSRYSDNPDFAQSEKVPVGSTCDWNLGPRRVTSWNSH